MRERADGRDYLDWTAGAVCRFLPRDRRLGESAPGPRDNPTPSNAPLDVQFRAAASTGPPVRGAEMLGRWLVRPSRPKLDLVDPRRSRLVGLVSIPRLDDHLGLFAVGEDLNGFLA